VSPNEVVVTIDGRPRPAVVVDRDGDRTLVRFRDAGGHREEWVPTASVVAVESTTERPNRLKLVGLGVLALLGLALLLYPSGSDRRLGDAPVTPSPSSSATPTPTATAAPTGAPVVHAVVVGDAFSAGKGSAPGTPTAVRLAAKALGWDASVLATPGSGFTTGGASAFGARLAALTSAPDVLVLQGGGSDTDATPEQLTAAAGAVLAQAAKRFPHTRVVLVGPVAMEQPPDGQLVRVDRTLRAVAARHKAAYLDPIALHWITAANAEGLTAVAGYYPNAAGHAYLGRQLAAALTTLLAQ
jgi:acyl-CoA thioesterase-1